MTFTTQTETIRSGTVSIQFYLPNSAMVNNEVYISSFGSLKYDFDIPQNSEEPTAVGSKPGSIEVGLIQSSRGRELVTAFSALQPSEQYMAILNFTERDSGIAGAMPFYFERSLVGYDELKDELTVDLHPIPLTAISQNNNGTYSERLISEYFNGDYDSELSSAKYIKTRTDTNEEIIHCSTFIFHVLEIMTRLTPGAMHADFSGDSYDWYVTNRDDYSLTKMLGVIASLQGSVYGSFFNGSFYVQRNLNPPSSHSTTIGWGDVENLKTDTFWQTEFSGLKVIMDSQSVGCSLEDAMLRRCVLVNNYGEKHLTVSFASNGLFKGDSSASDNVAPSGRSHPDLIEDGYKGYVNALGMKGNMMLECTVLGFQDIRPYSKIEFGSDAPSVYKGRTFAISSIEYNFITHKVRLKLYDNAPVTIEDEDTV